MNNKFSKFKYITIFLTGIFAVSIPATVSAGWSIYGLGTLGGSTSYATDINNSGQVVGTSTIFGDTASRAFITGSNGIGMTALDTLGKGIIKVTGINDSGQVIGFYNSSVGYHSFITGPNGINPTDLGALNGFYNNGGIYYESNLARGINESGQVVGEDGDAPIFDSDAFMTGPNGAGMVRLDIPETFVGAKAINDSGQVLGYAFVLTSRGEAYNFITGPNGNGMTVLENLGGTGGIANSINNLGQVAGGSYTSGRVEYHAFITGPNGEGITDLGTLGGTWSEATDINDSGQVIGNSTTASGSYHAFLFSNNQMIDLSLLSSVVDAGWTDIGVIAINDHGQIAGSGKLHGNTQAFLLSPFPVPEPSTYAMLLAGLGLLGFMARRRKESAM